MKQLHRRLLTIHYIQRPADEEQRDMEIEAIFRQTF